MSKKHVEMTTKTFVVYFSAALLLLSLTASSQSLLENPVTDSLAIDGDTDDNELPKYDPANAIRQSARNGGETEMVDASDIQKLRDRTNANISQTLSNTSLADLESDNLTQLLQSRYRERYVSLINKSQCFHSNQIKCDEQHFPNLFQVDTGHATRFQAA